MKKIFILICLLFLAGCMSTDEELRQETMYNYLLEKFKQGNNKIDVFKCVDIRGHLCNSYISYTITNEKDLLEYYREFNYRY